MPLHHAVLALLTRRPSHGYELKVRFEEAIGPQWGGLNIGHLYQILERLVRDGYVTRSQVAQADRPDKNLYTLTPSGADEVHTWATTAWVRTGGFRDELFLKLLGAVALGPEALATLIETQRQTYLSELAGLTHQRRAHADEPLVALLIDAAIAHTKADLGLLDNAAGHLTPLAAAQDTQTAGQQSPGTGSAEDNSPSAGDSYGRAGQAWTDSA
ncbi:PadR family transcriptional regulator [Streptomyces pseudovenezuelae]|uniref:DNA-binding PadR family transcriptional regulator n=1 Tax=Streptomyces pseudovenezuelae TaxID=67350 RepID=A0ABT6LNV9_9ACTN|nr:PadR family transcriptional regulator [Streptomyces pseudovenezuelae]MDH6218003.1 DNA-binding PadR family transcriptional regulator [Streptomyces pseudovenezuelae]